MDLIHTLLDLVLHLNKHLDYACAHYGHWIYLLLFVIVFAETGLVVTPFLPGDALLFTVGAIAARGALDPWILLVSLTAAAFLGGVSNYAIGRKVGDRFFTPGARILKRKYLDQTHAFFEKHGPKAVILARFLPLFRTFVPFVAGMGRMAYGKYLLDTAIGAALWVILMMGAGWFFGGISFIQNHFEVAVIGIILVSMLPAAYEIAKHLLQKKTPPRP